MKKIYTVLDTDKGYMLATWTDMGLWELDFPVADKPEVPEDGITELVDGWSQQLGRELTMYWHGQRIDFSVPIDWRGYTVFYTAVLKFTMSIPYGQTSTYGAIGQAIGSPKGARAVGGALHRNRVPIVIPCHRVLGSKGNLTGFAGGLELKQALLSLEGTAQ